MAILIRKIKSLNVKKTLSIVILAGMSAMVLSAASVSASGAIFNKFAITYTPASNSDLPLLDARNASKGEGFSTSQSDHDAGISAGPGDEVELQVYFHNGAANDPQNIAHNVVIRAQASPSLGAAASSHTISATISASDASTVSSADNGGNINIFIPGAQPQSLSLVPGSTKLFKNCGSPGGCQQSALPDTIFTSGVNVGDVQGCFEFHGFVNFKVRVSNVQPQGDFTINKQVRNVTRAIPFNDVQVIAQPGDTVEFKIVVAAIGGEVNVNSRDVMDTKLTLTGPVTVNSDVLDANATTAFFANGPGAGIIASGGSRTIIFQAKVASSGLSNGQILNNTAFSFTSTITKSDSAQVVVSIPVQEGDFTITKQVRNVSQTIGFSDTQVSAKMGDTVEFKIIVTAIGGDVNGISARDVMDTQLTLTGVVDVSGTTLAANQTTNFFGAGHLLGDIQSGQNRTIIFQAKVASSGLSEGQILNNVAHAFTSSKTKFDNAQVVINVPVTPVQVLHINKQVRNDSAAGSAFAASVNATPSQLLTFKITVDTNGSNTSIQTVTVKDVLPSKLTFKAGTLNVDGVDQSGSASTFFSTGLNIGPMAPNTSKVIQFQVDVASASNFATDCETLNNTGSAEATNIGPFTSTASAIVCKEAAQKIPGTPVNRPTT